MSVRRPLTHLAAVAATGALLAACGAGSEPAANTSGDVKGTSSFAAGSTMARLAEAGTMTVGTKFDQPGFGLQGLDGKPTGFDVKIAELVAAKLGIAADKITYLETPSKVREEAIEQGKVDLVAATYTINDERKKRVTFAGPYYVAGQDIMVGKDETEITGPESLKSIPDAKVCSVTGSSPSENIKQFLADPAKQLVLFDVYSKCADALKSGQVRAVTTDNVILLGLISTSKGEYKLIGNAFTQEPYGLGVKKGDVQFCEFVNATLKEAATSGAYDTAWTTTAGTVEGAQTPDLPEIAACA